MGRSTARRVVHDRRNTHPRAFERRIPPVKRSQAAFSEGGRWASAAWNVIGRTSFQSNPRGQIGFTMVASLAGRRTFLFLEAPSSKRGAAVSASLFKPAARSVRRGRDFINVSPSCGASGAEPRGGREGRAARSSVLSSPRLFVTSLGH